MQRQETGVSGLVRHDAHLNHQPRLSDQPEGQNKGSLDRSSSCSETIAIELEYFVVAPKSLSSPSITAARNNTFIYF